MRNLVMACLVAVVLMGVTSSAQSAEHLSGKVTRVYITSAGTVNFRLSGTCKTSAYFYFSLASDASKAWYAMLLSAATTQKPVRITIADSCDATVGQPIQYVYQDF